MFDTHTHIQFKIFDKIIDDVIEKSRKVGVKNILVVGTDLESSKKAVDLANQFNGIYASVGLHPHHVFEYHNNREGLEGQLEEINRLLIIAKVTAVGETGIDRHHYKKTKYPEYRITEEFIGLQKMLFSHQINLAKKYKKSLVIHNREAVDETLLVLKENWSEVLAGRSVFHCCEPDPKLLDFAKEYGIFIGIDGDVTYDKDKQKFVKQVPLELLVLETDSPFLVPKGKQFPNTPVNLKFIAQKIAQIKRIEQKEIEEITFKNGKLLFKL